MGRTVTELPLQCEAQRETVLKRKGLFSVAPLHLGILVSALISLLPKPLSLPFLPNSQTQFSNYLVCHPLQASQA